MPNDGPPPLPDLHPTLRVVVTEIERPPGEVVSAFQALHTGCVLDHLGKHGAMHHEVKPVFAGARVCGPALTVLGADWRLRFTAAELARPGDVIVIVPGDHERACFGDVTATRWQARCLGGLVVDGAVRDVAGIRRLGFPVFARHITPRTFHYPSGLDHGAVNVSVSCAGVVVHPGDLIVGDDDGVVVVPRAVAADLAREATDYLARETAKRESFAEGRAPVGVAADELRARGYRFI